MNFWFFLFMILSSAMIVSSSSWMMLWLGLEINMISFIPMMSSKINPLMTESSLKYFLTQVMASSTLMMAFLLMLWTNEFIAPQVNSFPFMLMSMALLMKMGASPFHFWFPEVMEGLTWSMALLILTIQKIAPMLVVSYLPLNHNLMMVMILSGLLISPLFAMNQTSLRKIMALSSINHMSWMLMSLLISTSLWMIYFLIYSITNFILTLIFKETQTYYVNQLWNCTNNNNLLKIILILSFLSLGGIPPFLGFMPKWFMINWMSTSMFWLAILITVLTLMMTYIYLRTIISTTMINLPMQKFIKIKINNKILIISSIISLTSLVVSSLIFNFI